MFNHLHWLPSNSLHWLPSDSLHWLPSNYLNATTAPPECGYGNLDQSTPCPSMNKQLSRI
ncbi:unnamed protein product [Meloidogyne enterolobii]|uniref:Uncharacterized protein n=1 Tax=Meloidogyne enterolobii TaxID=390850 RepID=A0ACB0Y6I9_MELEN